MYIIIDKVERVVCGSGDSAHRALDGWYWIGRIFGYAIQFAVGFGIGFAIKCAVTALIG